MKRRATGSRASQKQALLRQLATEEIDVVGAGLSYSRAPEAVEALRRIKDGTYGVCRDCRRRIPAARLQAKPEATRCLACQQRYEARASGVAAPTAVQDSWDAEGGSVYAGECRSGRFGRGPP